MDEATLELRRKIDEMLLASTKQTSEAEKNASMRASMRASADGGHGPLGAFHMEDFAVRGPPIRDEKEDIQNEVRSIIKACLRVEDEASEIKHGKPLPKHQKLYQEPLRPPTSHQDTKAQTLKRPPRAAET